MREGERKVWRGSEGGMAKEKVKLGRIGRLDACICSEE